MHSVAGRKGFWSGRFAPFTVAVLSHLLGKLVGVGLALPPRVRGRQAVPLRAKEGTFSWFPGAAGGMADCSEKRRAGVSPAVARASCPCAGAGRSRRPRARRPRPVGPTAGHFHRCWAPQASHTPRVRKSIFPCSFPSQAAKYRSSLICGNSLRTFCPSFRKSSSWRSRGSEEECRCSGRLLYQAQSSC